MLWKLAPMWWVLRSFGDALNELVEDNDALEMPNYA